MNKVILMQLSRIFRNTQLLYVFSFTLMISCKRVEDTQSVIQKYLGGVQLEKYNVEHIFFKKIKLSPEYALPFYIFISFQVDSSAAMEMFKNLKLIKYDSTQTEDYYDKVMCLRYPDVEKFFTIEPITYSSAIRQNFRSIEWWHPDTKALHYSYASYYVLNSSDSGMPVLCNKKYDGRIVGQYIHNQKKVYILVECFLRF
jgi:hypothetical protein